MAKYLYLFFGTIIHDCSSYMNSWLVWLGGFVDSIVYICSDDVRCRRLHIFIRITDVRDVLDMRGIRIIERTFLFWLFVCNEIC